MVKRVVTAAAACTYPGNCWLNDKFGYSFHQIATDRRHCSFSIIVCCKTRIGVFIGCRVAVPFCIILVSVVMYSCCPIFIFIDVLILVRLHPLPMIGWCQSPLFCYGNGCFFCRLSDISKIGACSVIQHHVCQKVEVRILVVLVVMSETDSTVDFVESVERNTKSGKKKEDALHPTALSATDFLFWQARLSVEIC